MAKKKRKLEAVDPKFRDELKRASLTRVQKGLARMTPKETSIREMTHLLTRTQGFQISLEELRTKKKRKNIK
jgi:hypothetical protein